MNRRPPGPLNRTPFQRACRARRGRRLCRWALHRTLKSPPRGAAFARGRGRRPRLCASRRGRWRGAAGTAPHPSPRRRPICKRRGPARRRGGTCPPTCRRSPSAACPRRGAGLFSSRPRSGSLRKGTAARRSRRGASRRRGLNGRQSTGRPSSPPRPCVGRSRRRTASSAARRLHALPRAPAAAPPWPHPPQPAWPGGAARPRTPPPPQTPRP
mmetsp:Transcript_31719/g.106866  ORF Transcript_31719/g.106866 Transcript_31719/m.106866 type:complete len:213 (-) Transcript_31719:350-988(-)